MNSKLILLIIGVWLLAAMTGWMAYEQMVSVRVVRDLAATEAAAPVPMPSPTSPDPGRYF